MAQNTFITPEVVSRTAHELLLREIVLPRLVWTDFDVDFTGSVGTFINVRVPARLTAATKDVHWDRTTPIVSGLIEEDSYAVQISKFHHDPRLITVDDLTFEGVATDFVGRVLGPQVRAVAELVENQLATTIENATYESELEVDGDDPLRSLTAAWKALNLENVPRDGRFAVVGAEIEEALLNQPQISEVDKSGSSDALTNATIRRLRGFQVVASNAIEPDTAYCFHRSAFILASRAPAVPMGAKMGNSVGSDGIAMRWTVDYDSPLNSDRSLVGTFTGTQVVLDDDEVRRAVKLVLPTS